MSRHNVFLTTASPLDLFMTFHLADDIVRGFEPGGTCRRQDCQFWRTFFWVWTLMALGVTATFSAVLSARPLWSARRDRPARTA